MRATLAVLISVVMVLPAEAWGSRIKELVEVRGVRENMLIGYGLVVGLSGTGDTERVLFTTQAVSSMLGRLGVRVAPNDVRSRNVAGVMVTAKLPAYARPGTHLDVTVSSLGNARALNGGVLLLTQMQGPDGKLYALAQGEVQVGGFTASAAGSSIQRNQPTAGRVPAGAIVERAVIPELGVPVVELELKVPDFTTANRIAVAINKDFGKEFAKALDPAAVQLHTGPQSPESMVEMLGRIELIEVEPDRRARIVISERTGTIVAGEGVRIRPVAVAHGGLQISITATPSVFQPNAFAKGRTVDRTIADVKANEDHRAAVALPATSSVQDLVKALNLLGVTPRDLIAILQAIKAAGAMDAELEVI